jgi:hypothetical protein
LLYIFIEVSPAPRRSSQLLRIWVGHATVVPAGRTIALAGAVLGGILLIIDLHTVPRFYNMLRIFRPSSAMSIGTYVLMIFGFWSLVVPCAQFAGLSWLAAFGGAIASVAGWGMMTYTAALLSSTSTPLWAAAPRLLAVRFAASAMATGAAALVMVAVWSAEGMAVASPLRKIVVLALLVELGAGVFSQQIYQDRSVDQPLRAWPWGLTLLAGVQFAGAALPSRSICSPMEMRVCPLRRPSLRPGVSLAAVC